MTGAGQTLPHTPQLVGDLNRSTHAPEQSREDAAQAAAHVPPEHFAVSFVHAVEQEPHVVGRLRSASQPLAASPSQFPHPGTQLPTAHAPAEQVICSTRAAAQGKSEQLLGSQPYTGSSTLTQAPAQNLVPAGQHTPGADGGPSEPVSGTIPPSDAASLWLSVSTD